MKSVLPTAGLVTLLLSSPLNAQRIATPQPSRLPRSGHYASHHVEHVPHPSHSPVHLSAHRVAPLSSTDRYVPLKQIVDINVAHTKRYDLVLELEREIEAWSEHGHKNTEYAVGFKTHVYIHTPK